MSFTSVMLERDSQTPGLSQQAVSLPRGAFPARCPHLNRGKREHGHFGIQQGEAHVPLSPNPTAWTHLVWSFSGASSPLPEQEPCSGASGSNRGGAQGHPLSQCPPCWAQGHPCQCLGTWLRGRESCISIPSWHQLCLSLPSPFCSRHRSLPGRQLPADSCPSISGPDGSPEKDVLLG